MPAASSEPRERFVAPLIGDEAFDLAATSEGAVLVWASPGGCAGSLRSLALDAEGTPQGAASRPWDACAAAPELSPATSQVDEVAVAAGAGQLGVAWVVEDRADGRSAVLASHGHDAGGAPSPPERLSESVPASDSVGRGRLELVATDSGQLLVAFRTTPGPCRAHDAPLCAHYVARPHPGPRPERGRGVEQREIPEPCARLLVGSLWLDGTWYDGVCAGEPPVTTVFVIRPEISYAAAVPVLSNCDPLGFAASAQGALVVGRCQGGLAVDRLTATGGADLALRDVTRTVACRQGRPLATLRAAAGAIEQALHAPVSRIELLLPETIARPGSRAVWTGERLLVASVTSTEATGARSVALAAYECRGDELALAR